MVLRSLACLLVALIPASVDDGAKDETPELPKTVVGDDVLGERIPLEKLRWLDTPGKNPPSVDGKVTLVRWWTDTCPFCERSLPVIQDLAEEFGERGLQTVAVYHPKPPRDVADDRIVADARERKHRGKVAADMNWGVLRELYLSKKRRPATSVTFLLDHTGRIRFVQPGPEFRPSKRRGDETVNGEYRKVRRAIEALLAELPAKPKTKKPGTP